MVIILIQQPYIENKKANSDNSVIIKGETAKAADTHSYLYWVTEPMSNHIIIFIVVNNDKF